MARILPLIFGKILGIIESEVMNMKQTYRNLYFEMVYRMGKAVEAFDGGKLAEARQILISAMQAGEEAHLEEDSLSEE